MQQAPVMPPCPLCGADGRFRKWEELVGEVKITGPKHKHLGLPIRALVCSQCGNMLLFVDPRESYGEQR